MTLQQIVAVEEVQQLVARGQEQNFLSLEEVAVAVEGLDMDPSAAEELYQHLDEMGIELLDEADARERIAQLSEEADRPRALNLTTETSTDLSASSESAAGSTRRRSAICAPPAPRSAWCSSASISFST